MHTFRYLSVCPLVVFLLSSQVLFAQVKDTLVVKDSVPTLPRNHFIIGVTYNSAMNYYGRVDSLKSSGIYPYIDISLKNGLYLTSTFVFTNNSTGTQYAATLLEAGYNFISKNDHWSGNLSASRYFYQAGNDLVQSAVKEVVSASLTELNKIINITLGANIKFSDKADIGVQAGLDHIIRIPDIFGKDVLVLDPSANCYAGTQNFTQTYLQDQKLLFFPVDEQLVTRNSQKFSFLSYEFSMPVVYAYRKLNLILTPAYIIPENIVTVSGQSGTSEKGANLFYFTAALKFTL
jgi:hypothetical protein